MKYEWYKSGSSLLHEIRTTSLCDAAAVWYIGQMGTIIKWNDTVICMDPILNDLCYPDGTTRRNYISPFAPEDVDLVDYVLCTHGHADHINLETLLPLHKVNPGMKLFVPVPEREKLICGGIDASSVIGVNEGDSIELGKNLRLHPIAAAHEEYRTDEDGNQFSLGYVLELGDIRIYHAGDSLVTDKLIEDVNRLGAIHIACLPINGVDFRRHKRGIIGNMDCRDAVYLAQEIHADLTLPMHFDMVKGNEENPLVFGYYMQELAPGQKYHVMRLGERYLYMI